MEGANRGPYARLIRLSNGRYKRVVDPVVPEIFLKLSVCCNCDINEENFNLLTKGTYDPYNDNRKNNGREYYSNGNNKLNSNKSSRINTHSDEDEYSTQSSISETEKTYSREYSKEEQILEKYDNENKIKTNKKSIIYREESIKNKSYSNFEDEEKRYDSNIDETIDEGIPVLFYTKTRAKPTLLMLMVDPDRQVIFMKRNKTNRFFPIKLIDKFVTSTNIIEEVFSKQIKNDPTVRTSNMVLFNAANFTDEVALQFGSREARDNFINEVNYVKDLIKKQF